MHLYVSRLAIIGWDNGLLIFRRQAIIWTSVGFVSIGQLGTGFSELKSNNLNDEYAVEMSSAKCWPFCQSSVFTYRAEEERDKWGYQSTPGVIRLVHHHCAVVLGVVPLALGVHGHMRVPGITTRVILEVVKLVGVHGWNRSTEISICFH